MRRRFGAAAVAIAVSLLAAAPVRAQLACGAFSAAPLPPPAPRRDPHAVRRWLDIDNSVESGHAGVLFLGDSLVERWDPEVWARHYAPLRALNAGVSGDMTWHLMWRLDHGNLAGPPPRAVVLLIGTNDLGAEHTPAETAEGIRSILAALRARLPQTRILLLGLLPRGRSPQGRLRAPIAEVNRLIRGCADGRRIAFLDLGPVLLDKDGTLPAAISPDRLHLSSAGYRLIAPRLDAALRQLLAD